MELASSSKQNNNKSQALLQKEKERHRKRVASAATEEDDPLAPYIDFVGWLVENEPHSEQSVHLELLEVLEDALRTYEGDTAYKTDLRYLKLWLTYAKSVQDPNEVYIYLLYNNIGEIYPQLYEDYALHLEQQGRFDDAETAYTTGMNKCTRAVERVKSRHRQFQQRVSFSQTLKPLPSRKLGRGESSSKGADLFKDPLQGFSGKRGRVDSKPSVHKGNPSQKVRHTMASSRIRPEKFCFDMSLLSHNGEEYCIQEARAKALGLLGKKWGPPPSAEPGPHQPPRTKVQVNFNDDGKVGSSRLHSRPSIGEPTVTYNTKEALKDVLGMFNSPDKTLATPKAPLGSKHAPVKRIEPTTPGPIHGTLRKIADLTNDENVHASGKIAGFRPFVDEENKKENATPAPKFKPFVDENVNSQTPHITPAPRKALREIKTPIATPAPIYEDDEDTSGADEIAQESQPKGVFSRVFTPKEQSKGGPDHQVEDAMDAHKQSPISCNPLVRQQNSGPLASKVFSRPSESKSDDEAHTRDVFGEKATIPNVKQDQSHKEAVFRRKSVVLQRQAFAPISRDRQPPVAQFELQEELEPEPESGEDDEMDDNDVEVEDVEPAEPPLQVDAGEGEPCYEDEESYRIPMGGRFGQFDVMTPIAERTYEYTMTTRTSSTPSNGDDPLLDKGILYHDRDAAAAAERLAKEIREDEERVKNLPNEPVNTEDADSDVSVGDDLVEKTGTLSLADAIEVASAFKPANPCNPSDPNIINTLLSVIPPEPEFYDLRAETSGCFDRLQKFASKLSTRRNSGRSISSSPGERVQVPLQNRYFEVTEKLGEGGFGAVFKAKDVSPQLGREDGDSDLEDDDDDAEDSNLVALKVVKPRNIWEFHVLRRVHSALPATCRSSIVTPRALYVYRDESFLVLDLCSQGTLLDMVNRANEAGFSQQGACLDELLVTFFAIELLKFIEVMHAAGFIHGDFKIDNCLLRLDEVPGGPAAWSSMYQPSGSGGWQYKGIKMIDFGRTIDTRMFPSGQKFIADWKTDVGDCLEMRENMPWTFQTDYFGLAGVVHCMLFGKYFDAKSVVPVPSSTPVRYKLASQFKRYWQVDLWTRFFDTLLNPTLVKPDGSLPITTELSSLRGEMETWLLNNCSRSTNTLKGLLKKVERSVLSGTR